MFTEAASARLLLAALHHQGGQGHNGPDLHQEGHSGSLMFDRVGSERVPTSAMHGVYGAEADREGRWSSR